MPIARKVSLDVPGFDWYRSLPASPAVRHGDLIFISGQVARSSTGTVLGVGDEVAQSREAFEGVRRVLEFAGGSLDDVVDFVTFHKDIRSTEGTFEVARELLDPPYPAWTPVGMTGSYEPDLLISISAIADLSDDPKEAIVPHSSGWIERYPVSPGCRKRDLLFISGLVESGRDGGREVAGDHAADARAAYAWAQDILDAAGGSLEDVIDICSFHLDPRGMVACERVHMETWAEIEPSGAAVWTAIGVPALFTSEALCQYRFIADFSAGPRIGRVSEGIHWKDTPNAGASRKSQGRLIAIAGEVASDGEGNVTTPGDTAGQARYAFNRIREVIEMHGASMDDVVQVISFHKDHRAWPIVMDVGREYFDLEGGPAWTPCGATGLWNSGYLHEIYAVAVLPETEVGE